MRMLVPTARLLELSHMRLLVSSAKLCDERKPESCPGGMQRHGSECLLNQPTNLFSSKIARCLTVLVHSA
jgi:hypothetical protein